MKKNKIVGVGALALMMLGSNPAFAAENKAADFQASAQIENTCLIEADDVNFGQVYAPLTTQGTKSEMRVLCSKNTPYTIDLAYGGVYGSGTSAAGSSHSITPHSTYSDAEKTLNYVKFDGAYTGDVIYCYKNGEEPYLSGPHLTPLKNQYANIYDNACFSDFSVNYSYIENIARGDSYNYGIMAGASKGDNLAYRITVPGDINKVWNTGNGSYKATASGEFDKIEVNAQIVPENSSSLYLAQDSYFDTVTAVISY